MQYYAKKRILADLVEEAPVKIRLGILDTKDPSLLSRVLVDSVDSILQQKITGPIAVETVHKRGREGRDETHRYQDFQRGSLEPRPLETFMGDLDTGAGEDPLVRPTASSSSSTPARGVGGTPVLSAVIETGPAPGAGSQGGAQRNSQPVGYEPLDRPMPGHTKESAKRVTKKSGHQELAANGNTASQQWLYGENRKKRLGDYNAALRITKACVVRLPADYYGTVEGFWNAPPAKQHFDEDHVFTLRPEKGSGPLAEQYAYTRKFEKMADEYVGSVLAETAQNLRGIARGDRTVEPGAFDEQSSPHLAMKVIARVEPFLTGLPTLDHLYTSGLSKETIADHQNRFGIFVENPAAAEWCRHALECEKYMINMDWRRMLERVFGESEWKNRNNFRVVLPFTMSVEDHTWIHYLVEACVLHYTYGKEP